MPDTITLTTTTLPLPMVAPPSAPVAAEELGSGSTGTGAAATGSRGTRKLDCDENAIAPSTRKATLTLA